MNQQIYEEACEWFIRMREQDNGPAAQSALMSWLKRSPEHVSAYLDIAAIWREARTLEVDSQLDMAARITEARADSDIAELHAGRQARRARPGAYRLLALAASLLIAIGAAFVVMHETWGTQRYSTELGELRSIALPDGSTVELNSASGIEIQFAKAERRIELVQGQALFRVARDPHRPFTVHTDGTSVRAVGTAFDVYRKRDATVVTVLEGKVAVQGPGEAGLRSSSLLSAGKQAIVQPGISIQPKPANISAATAWTRRQLVFEFTPLAQAAEEFNRYNARKLIVEGDALRAFKISAIFESTNPAALVKFLRGMPELEVVERDGVISVVPKDEQTN